MTAARSIFGFAGPPEVTSSISILPAGCSTAMVRALPGRRSATELTVDPSIAAAEAIAHFGARPETPLAALAAERLGAA